ncbi:hypothetical protein [Nocardia cyriacigeorgica]|uniref:hypothetical protein n=1 Tax=Nocardia cyriacigeorgica TaxID=135487 RepID=UPI002B4B0D77|nr:hypothetical protein [Nocardia cyriacigeorgica]
MSARARGGRSEAVVAAVYSALLTLVVAGPLLGPGYLLLRDAVSTPRSYLTDSALGLGDAAPRAVPQDALLAALSTVVDGGLIVKAILLAALWAAGYGAAVLSRVLLGAPLAAQLVAVTVAVWNPFVAERLLQGHWSLLTGYAALPWTALAAHRLRQRNGGQRNTGRGYRDWAVLAGCFAAAGLTPTGALLAGLVGLTVAGRRNLPGVLALLIAACAPWLVATIASGAGTETSDPAGIAAFAARAEPGLGTLGSLAGLGGIWNADAVPWSRTMPLAFIGTAILLVLVALGVRTVAGGFVRRRTATDSAPTADSAPPSAVGARPQATPAPDETDVDGTGSRPQATLVPDAGATDLRPATSDSDQPPSDRPTPALDLAAARTGRRLLGLAVAAVLLPALGATAWGMDALEWLVVEVPGAGLLRDAQKYVALAMPAYALSAAAGCVALATRFGARAAIAEPDIEPDRAAAKPGSPPLAAGSRSGASTPAPAEIGRGSAADTADTTDTAEYAEHDGTPAAHEITEAPQANGTVGSPDTAHSTLDRADPAGHRPHQDSRGIPDDVDAPNAPDTQSRAESAPVTIRRRPTAGPVLTAIAALFIAALILPLIDLAWGVGGEMRAVRYPAAWREAAARVDGPGDVAVLPGGMFRKFPYSGSAPVLDPAPRMLPNDVLQTGELPVRGQTVSGEGARARRVEQLLLDGGSPEELAALGVGWVLVEHRTPGPRGESETTLAQLEPVLNTPDLSLYRVGGVVTEASSAHRPLVIGAHVLWGALLLVPLLTFVPAPRRFDRNR